MKGKETDLVVQRVDGGSIIDARPVFSLDAETLYVVYGPALRAYSVNTGELIGEYEGLKANAVGVRLHPTTPNIIVACSERGELIQWDWHSKLPSKSVDLQIGNSAVKNFYLLPPEKRETVEDVCRVCVVLTTNNNNNRRVSIWCSETGTQLHRFKFQINDKPHSIALGGRLGTQYLAVIHDRSLQYTDINNCNNCDRQYAGKDRHFTTVACHPEMKCIATGDNTGRILLWWNILSSGSPTYSIHHWHTLPCDEIIFSDTGTQFFSGGGEAVLVRWYIDSDYKDFLPRQSSTICHLAMAPENKYLAICTTDNGIKIIYPNFKICSVIQHFSWCTDSQDTFPAGIAFCSLNRTLVMNSRTGHIQFYSPRIKSIIYNMDITGLNYISQERNTVIVNTDVTKISLNSRGDWMATVEHRDDGESHMETRLKFWHFDEVKQDFCLNTSVDLPHDGVVHAIAFQPSQDPLEQLAVTSGSDFKFRTWALRESTNIRNMGNLVWKCENVGFYRNLPVGDLSFSMDGSLLAVAFGPTLTVWIPETNQVKCSLTPERASEHLITQVEFGQTDCYHLIVTSTPQNVNVWNLLTLKLMWTVPVNVSKMAADPCSEFMAVFSTHNDLYVFSPRSPNPTFSRKNISTHKIVCAAFIPRTGSEKTHGIPWQEYSQLYFFNSKQELLVLDIPEDTTEREGIVLPMTTLQALTPFSSILAKQSVSKVEKFKMDTQQQLGVPGATAIKELLNVPSHTMPPVHLLCRPFLCSLVASDKKNTEEDREEYEMQTEDSGLDSDDDTDVKYTIKTELPSTIKEETPTVSEEELDVMLANILKEKMDWTKLLVNVDS